MLRAASSPSVTWSATAGVLRCGQVEIELEAPPPVASLHQATRIHWEPQLAIALCVVDGVRRSLTRHECDVLQRWAHVVETAAVDARDGTSTLVVVVG